MSTGSGRAKLFALLNKSNEDTASIASTSSSGIGLSENITPSNAGSSSRQQLMAKLRSDSELNFSNSNTGRGKLFLPSSVSTTSSLSGILAKTLRVDDPTEPNSDTKSSHSDELRAEEEQKKCVKQFGIHGTKIPVAVNYIRLNCEPERSVFEYDVRFEPVIHSNTLRYGLLSSLRDHIGKVKTFDGSSLYLPIELPARITKLTTNKSDGSAVLITIIFRKKKQMYDRECVHLYNVLFKQLMKLLEYVQFGQKQFDPTNPKMIPQHKLSVWPGYVMAVDDFHGGLMLMLDVSHRVLCTKTVYDLMQQIYYSCEQNPSQNFRDTFLKSILGAIVLTRYNNKTYRVDDVDFVLNPESTFQTKTETVSYVQYYKVNHDIHVNSRTQPLLINHKERRVASRSGGAIETKESIMIALIPELCYLTGLTDEMRNDNKVMRDIATFTRVTPNQRMDSMRKFVENVNNTPAAKDILAGWGLSLDPNPLDLNARQLPVESLTFGNNIKISAGISGDFSNDATNTPLFDVVNLTNWMLMYTREDSRQAQSFLTFVDRCAGAMGITVTHPTKHVLPNDKTETYVQWLRRHLKHDTQIIVLICPTSRDDRYAAIKKVCCTEMPIASQVINSRTLRNEQKNRAIVQKILLQMNCKLGGSLWTINIPFKNVMICGVDTYHDPAKISNSVAAFVASLNNTFTRWYSKATIQLSKEELMHGLTVSLQKSLEAYKRMNQQLPDRIIIYRDGVGDSQFELCKEYELPQLKSACRLIEPDYNPTITFIVVQKRINTRIFQIKYDGSYENPNPGSVLDHTIARRFLFDFFLISQNVRHGTVTPTHLVVLENEAEFSPDVLQRLSYKLCFQYYNWPGTVRVPACCQYAHKMASLIGQSIKRETGEVLAYKLFYL